jgi:hypothetical protein
MTAEPVASGEGWLTLPPTSSLPPLGRRRPETPADGVADPGQDRLPPRRPHANGVRVSAVAATAR